MRRPFTVITILATLSCAAAPAAAQTVTTTGTITGALEATWRAAGGSKVLGNPVGTRDVATIAGRTVYDQGTTRGYRLFWSSSAGSKVWKAGSVPSLSGISRERDPLGRYGLRGGKVWRSGRLSGGSTTADQLLTAQLNPGGLIIDLRTPGSIDDNPDPRLPGVSWRNFPVASGLASDYRKYVTTPEARRSFGAALNAIAAENSPVLIHCTAGKDRTGWLVLVLMSILGADRADIIAEHLRSGTDRSNVTRALDEVANRFGRSTASGVTGAGMYSYVRNGLGVSKDTIAKLRSKYGR